MKNYLGQRKSFEFLLRKKQIFGLGRLKVEEYIGLAEVIYLLGLSLKLSTKLGLRQFL